MSRPDRGSLDVQDRAEYWAGHAHWEKEHASLPLTGETPGVPFGAGKAFEKLNSPLPRDPFRRMHGFSQA